MAQGSGFFKGDKKKKKKGEGMRPISAAPTFVAPSIIPKGKDKF